MRRALVFVPLVAVASTLPPAGVYSQDANFSPALTRTASPIIRSPYDPARWPSVAAWVEGRKQLEAAGHYAAAGDWERTDVVLSRAIRLLPNDPDIRESAVRARALYTEERDRQLAVYKALQGIVQDINALIQLLSAVTPGTSTLDFDDGRVDE